MCAARAIPQPETVWPVTIDSNFNATPPAFIMQPGDSVNFINNSGSSISIEFDTRSQPQPMFSNTPAIANGSSYEEASADDLNGSQMYSIYVNGVQQSGRFAIQVGYGPLFIEVTNGETVPDPAVLPVGGTLRIIDSANQPWLVEDWQRNGQPCSSNPFNPPLETVGYHQVTTGAGVYTYGLSSAEPRGGDGGGTIKVTS